MNPALSDISSKADLTKQLPVDFGFLTEMSDPTVTKALMDGIKMLFTQNKDMQAKVTTTGQTGVEMEALTAIAAAGLTIYDMCKAVDRGMTITDIRLMKKMGGKSGTFERT